VKAERNLVTATNNFRSGGTSVTVVTRFRAGWLGFDSRQGFLLFTTASRMALGPTQPLIQWVPGAFFSGVKRPGRGVYNSPPLSAKVKYAWSCISTLPHIFMMWCLVKHGILLHGLVFS